MKRLGIYTACLALIFIAHQIFRDIDNVSWMDRRVEYEKVAWTRDALLAAQAQELIATDEDGSQIFHRSWALWINDVAKEYGKL